MRVFRLLLRLTFSALLLASLWFYWWFWPEQPVHRLRIDGNCFPRFLIADGQCVWMDESIQLAPGKWGSGAAGTRWRSIRLADGRELLSVEAVGWPMVLNRGRCVVLHRPDRRNEVFSTVSGELICTIPDVPDHKNRSMVGYSRSKYIGVGDYEQPTGHELWDIERGVKLRDIQRVTTEDFSASGEFMVQRGDHEWTLVETESGKVVHRSNAELLIHNPRTALRPDGKALAIHTPEDDHVTVVSLPDLKTFNRFKINDVRMRTQKFHFSRSGGILQGRSMPQSGLWNLNAPGSEYIAAADEGEHTAAYVTPGDRSYVVVKSGLSSTWNLYHVGKADAIASGGFGNSLTPIFSNDGQWLAMCQMIPDQATSTTPFLLAWLRSYFRIEVSRLETLVFTAATGRIERRIPGSRPVGFTPDNQSLWTCNTDQDFATGRMMTTLLQWSAQSPLPPWWLWLLTVAIAGSMYWPIRARRKAIRVETPIHQNK